MSKGSRQPRGTHLSAVTAIELRPTAVRSGPVISARSRSKEWGCHPTGPARAESCDIRRMRILDCTSPPQKPSDIRFVGNVRAA